MCVLCCGCGFHVHSTTGNVVAMTEASFIESLKTGAFDMKPKVCESAQVYSSQYFKTNVTNLVDVKELFIAQLKKT